MGYALGDRAAYSFDRLLDRFLAGVQHQVGAHGSLIRGVDTCHPGDLPGTRTGVQALGIAALAQLQWGVDEDFEEGQSGFAVKLGRLCAIALVRAHEADDRDRARLGEQARNVSGTTNVLGARLLVEAKVAVEPVAQVVTVQQEGMTAFEHQPLLDRHRYGRLAGGGQAGQPDRRPGRAQRLPALVARDGRSLPNDIGAAFMPRMSKRTSAVHTHTCPWRLGAIALETTARYLACLRFGSAAQIQRKEEKGRAIRSSDVKRPGAYGLHLPTLAGAGDLLVDAPGHWGDWHVEFAAGSGRPAEFVDDRRARLLCQPSGWVDIDRASSTSTLHLPKRPAAHEIAQPRLGMSAAIAAHWRGSHSFHAGVFLAGGAAWGVLGDKGAGKSSLMATLALMGVPVLADDALVLDGRGQALAGPRCIDLRKQTAAELDAGESIGVVGTRERFRMHLAPVPCEAPLRGFISLGWGKAAFIPIPPEHRVGALVRSFALRLPERSEQNHTAFMELLALPMVRFRRPRALARIEESAQRLLLEIEELDATPF